MYCLLRCSTLEEYTVSNLRVNFFTREIWGCCFEFLMPSEIWFHLIWLKSSQSIDRSLNVQNYSTNDTAYIPEDLNPHIFTFWSIKTFCGLTFLNRSSQHFQLKPGVIIVSRVHVALVVCLFALTPLVTVHQFLIHNPSFLVLTPFGWLCCIMLTPYLFHYFSWECCWFALTFSGTQLGHKRRTWCTDYY